MTKRRRRVLVALVIAGAAVAAIRFGAEALVTPWLRGTVERLASRALGRDLKIAGPFHVSFSLAPRVTAGDVRLANAPWGSEPSMVRAGRVAMVVDLVSLWSGPARVRGLEVENVRLLLEADGVGRGNWVLPEPASREPPEPARGPPVVLERAAIRGLEMVFRPRPEAEPVALGVSEFEARLDPATRMIDVRGGGQLNQAPWEISGRLGTFEKLYQGREVELALSARIGASRLETRGRVRDLLALGGPELDVSVEGPDIAAPLGTFGLRSPLTGAFQLRGRFTPAKDGVDLDVSAAVGAVTAKAQGGVRALLSLEALHVTVEAAGPDASLVGSWVGLQGLPPRPFDLSARVRREDRRIHLESGRTRVGPTSLTFAGVLGAPPRFVGTDLSVRATGRDLSKLSKLAGLRLPPGPFEVAGRFLLRVDGLAVDAVELRFRGAVIRAGGTLGEPPRLANLDLAVEASGPDLAVLSRLATVELPQAPFALRGRVARDGRALTLDAVEGRLGDDTVSVAGRLVLARRLEGTSLQVRVAGPDLAKLASWAGLGGVPAEPFEVKGRLRVVPGGYQLDDVDGTVGRVSAAVEGRIGAPTGLDGTSLSCRARGAALSDLAAWGLPENLPADPFSVAGRLRVEEGVYHVDGVVANVGPDRAGVNGALGALPDLSRLDAVVEAAGPSLAGVGRFLAAARLEAPGRVPAVAYEISGRVRRRGSAGYELHEVRAKAGETVVRLGGMLGSGKGLLGTDLRFSAEAPDASLLSGLAGTPLARGALEAHGRLARVEQGLLLDGVAVSIGDAIAEASGALGAWPRLEGTELRIKASGPNLAATLGPVAGVSRVPAAAFEVSADLAGSVEHLAARRFAARLGGSDLEGSLSMRLDGKPAVDAELRSRRLDVAELLTGFGAAPAAGATPAAAARQPDHRRLIPDDPLNFGALRSVDGALRLEVAALLIPGVPLRDVVATGGLRDGALRVERAEGTGLHGGRATAGLALEPSGGGYRLAARGRLEGGRLAPRTGASPEKAPSLDVEFQLKGEGESLHDIAASLDGMALVVVGSGEVSSAYERVTSGALARLADALNPFRKSSDHTDFECGVALAAVEHGKATVAPIAARSDKVTVVGHGKVDLDTEEIDLVWTLKPRGGVGLSPGSIANPYVKLGGTLSSPRLEVKPLEAAASTGAAVATLGLTVLLKGFYDRITAEMNVCVDALVKAKGTVPRER